jgi:hypothetical protein
MHYLGNCAIVLRMAKDFGDDVLPLRNRGYSPGSHHPPMDQHDWPDIIDQVEQLVSNCVWGGITEPGWARVSNRMIVLLLPMDSQMRKQCWLHAPPQDISNSSLYLSDFS